MPFGIATCKPHASCFKEIKVLMCRLQDTTGTGLHFIWLDARSRLHQIAKFLIQQMQTNVDAFDGHRWTPFLPMNSDKMRQRLLSCSWRMGQARGYERWRGKDCFAPVCLFDHRTQVLLNHGADIRTHTTMVKHPYSAYAIAGAWNVTKRPTTEIGTSKTLHRRTPLVVLIA